MYKIIISAYKGTFLLILKLIIEIIKTETEASKKKTLLKLERSKPEKKGITVRIPCSSKILFKKRDSNIFAPRTKFKNLFVVL